MTIKNDVINNVARKSGGNMCYALGSLAESLEYTEVQIKRAIKDLKHIKLSKGIYTLKGRKTPQSTVNPSLPRYFWTSRDKNGKGITFKRAFLTR